MIRGQRYVLERIVGTLGDIRYGDRRFLLGSKAKDAFVEFDADCANSILIGFIKRMGLGEFKHAPG